RPFSRMQRAFFQKPQNAFVQVATPRIDRLLWCASELHRRAQAAAFDLTMLEETHAGESAREKKSRGETRWSKAHHCARLVVILEKVHARPALFVRQRVLAAQCGPVAVRERIQDGLV